MPTSLQVQVEKAKKSVREANRQLKHFESFERRFLMAIFHSVKTPVNIVKNSLWMLRKGRLSSADRRKYLDMAAESNERLSQVINSLQVMSQLEMNKIRLQESKFDMAGFVNKITIRWIGLATKNGKKIKLKLPQKCVVRADKEKVGQIIDHLIGNVLRFASPGEVKVELKNQAKSVVCCVSDHGPGIPTKVQKNLFKRFMHLGSSDDMFKHKSLINTGLGLWIIKNLVKRMNGEFSYKTNRDRGTEFCFTLHKALK